MFKIIDTVFAITLIGIFIIMVISLISEVKVNKAVLEIGECVKINNKYYCEVEE